MDTTCPILNDGTTAIQWIYVRFSAECICFIRSSSNQSNRASLEIASMDGKSQLVYYLDTFQYYVG